MLGLSASSSLSSIDPTHLSEINPLVVGGVVIGFFVVLAIAFGSLDRARVAFLYVGGFLLVSAVAHLFLPVWAQPAVWLFVGAGLPAAWSHLDWNHYIDRLAAQDADAHAESTQSSGEAHIGARLEQARAVMRDPSPVFTIGVAMVPSQLEWMDTLRTEASAFR